MPLDPDPQTLYVPRLEHPQQLSLGFEGQTLQLVQKQRPPIRELDIPDRGFHRPRERAALVTEQQALDHVARQGATVHVHERAPAPTQPMDVLREQLLAGASRANEEHWQARRRIALCKSEGALDRGRAADDHGLA